MVVWLVSTMAEVAKKFDLKLVSIEDLVAYRMQHDSLIIKKEDYIETLRYFQA
jgi:3,4-dihydroxy 2-butanone 4-phosphate synthase/GTP cyclohydrolase II